MSNLSKFDCRDGRHFLLGRFLSPPQKIHKHKQRPAIGKRLYKYLFVLYICNTSYVVIYEKPCAQRDKRSRHVAEAPCMHNCIYDAALAWLPPLYNEYLNAGIFLPELARDTNKSKYGRQHINHTNKESGAGRGVRWPVCVSVTGPRKQVASQTAC